jgi:alginate O-acetyltransferase complex protein AlgI
MPLNSFWFVVFFLTFFVVYWILARNLRKAWLLLANAVFCSLWDWRLLFLLTISITADYFIGLKIGSLNTIGDLAKPLRKKLLIASLSIQLLLLGFFKYFNFFSESLGYFLSQFGIHVSPLHLNLVLPVGMSFYTFKTMTYTLDIYYKRFDPTRSFIAYADFVSFFPAFLSGPIDRAKSLLPQILRGESFIRENILGGAHLLFLGFFKKVFIADNLAPSVQQLFSLAHPSGWDAISGGVLFYFQLYADFSGYTDMAMGCAKCLGFQLSLNFNRPYLARNPADFWQRWHISLSTWLRDYLFFPLGGAFRTPVIAYRNLAITMLLAGLWHGASLTFVLWGGYYAILLVGYRLIQPRLKRWGRTARRFLGRGLRRTVKILVTFLLVSLGWIIFRAGSWLTLKTMAGGLLHWSGFPNPMFILNLFFFAGPLILLEAAEKSIFKAPIYQTSRLSFWAKTAVYAVLFYLWAFKGAAAQSFIYAQF